MSAHQPKPTRIQFVANCVYGDHVAGGDVHFFHMAKAALGAGMMLNFFGGHALQGHLKERKILCTQTLTDKRKLGPVNMESLGGQLRLLVNYLGRFGRSLLQLRDILRTDVAYAVTDYWFDAWPVILSRAHAKVMILGMDAPTLRDIVFRTRPDVPAIRLNSIYWWLSQNLSLLLFRFCRNKHLLYVHPSMKPRLLRFGYREAEISFVSNGFDLAAVRATPTQAKEFDVMWLGRLHRQKGIDDLLATLAHLRGRLPDVRIVIAGRVEEELRPRIEALGLADNVHFPGRVSEAEKFRLFKASRVFLMPSRCESWGIVMAEALAGGAAVVAYDLEAYRPIFGDLVRYVPCFDLEKFKAESLAQVEAARRGQSYITGANLAEFQRECSWEAAGERFLAGVRAVARC